MKWKCLFCKWQATLRADNKMYGFALKNKDFLHSAKMRGNLILNLCKQAETADHPVKTFKYTENYFNLRMSRCHKNLSFESHGILTGPHLVSYAYVKTGFLYGTFQIRLFWVLFASTQKQSIQSLLRIFMLKFFSLADGIISLLKYSPITINHLNSTIL